MGAVLRGMIAPHLVVGAAVGRTQIDVFEPVVLQAEGNADETARAFADAGGGTSASSSEIVPL